MTISERNVVERWNLMASKDLGTRKNIEAHAYARMFSQVFEDDQEQPFGDSYTNPTVRGFAINNPWYGIDVVECFDINHINITKEAAHALDWYLMHRKRWFEAYRYAVEH